MILKARWILRKKGRIFQQGQNLVVNAGYLVVAKRLGGIAVNPLSHVAIGTGATVPALTQTTLATQLGGRTALSAAAAGVTLTLTATIPGPSPEATIVEMGIFNAAVAGDMFSRFLTNAFQFGDPDDIDFEWILTFE